MTESADLPLFPLSTVLFPRQLLPLHIFEERYKLMIGECLRDHSAFGVVLIKEGNEVGEPALPFDVGTTASILDTRPLGEGRMALRTLGQQPFRILDLTQQRPYMRAVVELLDYQQGDAAELEALSALVREQFSAYLDILSTLTGLGRPALDLEVDPESLSYLVASVMSIDMVEKQRLLELDRAVERLRLETSLLSRENRAFQSFLYLQGQAKRAPGDEAGASPRISPN